jgi:hypothetical protein
VGALGILLSFAIVGTLPQPQEPATGFISVPSDITSDPKVNEINFLSQDLLNKKDSYRTAIRRTDRDAILKSMLDSSNERKNILLSLMENDTAAALKVTSLAKSRSQFPLSVQQNIEEEVTIDGLLEIIHVDDFENPQNSKFLHYVKSGKDRFSLHSAEEIPLGVNGTNLVSSTKVRVKGLKLEKKVAISGFENVEITGEIPGSVHGSHNNGTQETLVILVYFSDKNISGVSTVNQVKDTFFGTGIINDYYTENSYGKASIVGDVVGWYKLDITQTCVSGEIKKSAIRAADPFVNFANYERIIIVAHPKVSGCGYGGLGTIGKTLLDNNDGISSSTEFISASIAWLWSDYVVDNPGITLHELGHNFGGLHANLLVCNPAATDFVMDSCTSSEYGDPWNVLGAAWNWAQLHAYHKEIFHWLPPENILTVQYSGTYSVNPLETSTNGIQALKVIIPGKSFYYYVESRRAIGFDVFQTGNLFNGVLIHVAPYYKSGGDSSLIDANRATTTSYDSALVAGQSFVDSVSGVTIKALEFSEGTYKVQVSGLPNPPNTIYHSSISVAPDFIQVYRGDTKTAIATVKKGVTETRSCSVELSIPSITSYGSFTPANYETFCDNYADSDNCKPSKLTIDLSLPPGETGTSNVCDISTSDPLCDRQLNVKAATDVPYGLYERYVRTLCKVGDPDEEEFRRFNVKVIPYDYTVSLSQKSGTIQAGQSVSTQVSVSNGKGPVPIIPFVCLGLPTGAKCSFSNNVNLNSDTFSDGTTNGWSRNNKDSYLLPVSSSYLRLRDGSAFSDNEWYRMLKKIYVPPLEGKKLTLSFDYRVYSQGRGGLDAKLNYGAVDVNLPVVDVDGEPDDDVRYTNWASFSQDISSVASQTSITPISIQLSTFDSEDEHTYLELDNVVMKLEPTGAGGCIPTGSPKSCSSGMTISTASSTPVGKYPIKVVGLSAETDFYKFDTYDLTVELGSSITSPITHMYDTTIGTATYVNSSRPMVAIYVTPTSALIGDKIDSITMRLKKQGLPTGNLQVGVLRADGTFKYQFGIKDVSTLTTTYKDYTFTVPNPELYVIQSGDRIGIKYTGGNAKNYISVIKDTTSANPFDGTNTYYVAYNTKTSSWVSTTSHDLYMILKQKD